MNIWQLQEGGRWGASVVAVIFAVILVLLPFVGCSGLRLDTEKGGGSGDYDDGYDPAFDDDSDAIRDRAKDGRSPQAQLGSGMQEDGRARNVGHSNSARHSHSFGGSEVITRGMTTDDVRALMGKPTDVDYAGAVSSGNQRWTYSNGLSDQWKLRSPRVIYFEADRVVGWSFPRD